MNASASLVLVVCLAATFSSGCTTGPAAFRDKFGVDTGNARIERFYFSGFGMDHAYLWILEPADDAVIDAMVKSAGLARAGAFEASGLRSRFPAWWDTQAIDALPEAYFRDANRTYWRIWVDRKSNRIFAQWFDT